jgi:hypothetical protein
MTKGKDLEIEDIICFLNGELSLMEMEDLCILINTSDENIETFKNIRDIWLLTSEHTPLKQYEINKSWKKVEHATFKKRRKTIPDLVKKFIKSFKN